MAKHEKGTNPGYETQDIQSRPAVMFALVILLTLAGALVLATWFYSTLDQRFVAQDTAPSPLANPDKRPPEPRLQVLPAQELQAARERDRLRLEEYRWIDKPQGIVQIPIDRAITLLAERGIAPVPSPEPGRQP